MQDHLLTEVALMRAVGAVAPKAISSTMDVVSALRRVDGDAELRRHGGYMGDFLTEAAKTSPWAAHLRRPATSMTTGGPSRC